MTESNQEFDIRRRSEYIAALEEELKGYKRYDREELAAGVRAELKRARTELEEHQAAAAARAEATAVGVDVMPAAAVPYAGVAYRELQELVKARELTPASKSQQDLVDALLADDKAKAAADAGPGAQMANEQPNGSSAQADGAQDAVGNDGAA